MSVRLDTLRECLEGIIPGHIVTCDPAGMPNVAFLSQVEFVDNEHVALSYQFFQGLIGGCYHAHIHRNRTSGAYTPNLSVFQDPQHLGLGHQWHITNFI